MSNTLVEKFMEAYDQANGLPTRLSPYVGISANEIERMILQVNPDEPESREMAEAVVTAASASALGRRGGSKTSPTKKASSAANGRKGGRPRKS